MKNSTVVLLALTFGLSAFASENCESRAVSIARSNSNLGKLADFSSVSVERDYLLGYRVQIISNDGRRSDTFRIVLMKSDCSTVSVIREF